MCLNLLLSDNSDKCLGMMRIICSMKAEDDLKLIETELEDFELNLNNHIFGMVPDEASVMEKIRRLSQIAHGLSFSWNSPLRNDDL